MRETVSADLAHPQEKVKLQQKKRRLVRNQGGRPDGAGGENPRRIAAVLGQMKENPTRRRLASLGAAGRVYDVRVKNLVTIVGAVTAVTASIAAWFVAGWVAEVAKGPPKKRPQSAVRNALDRYGR